MFRTFSPLLVALLALGGCEAWQQDTTTAALTQVLPAEGAVVALGADVELAVLVDMEDALRESAEVIYTSDLDGELCVADVDEASLARCVASFQTPGTHLIDAEATLYGDPLEGITFRVVVVADAGLLDDKDGDGWSTYDGDCDDNDANTYPHALELVDGRDNDCDGFVDEGIDTVDDDLDGYAEADGDCDDTDPKRNPGARELLDGIDNDCDGKIDEDTVASDDDGDGLSERDGDCDDSDPLVGPGMPERENGRDDDCDGVVDEGTTAFDDDGDGFTERGGDCDDANIAVFPGARELVNGIDDDCDGIVDEGTDVFDDDLDGFSEIEGDCNDGDAWINPDAIELSNGLDDDCDGVVDEADGVYTGSMVVWVSGGASGACEGELVIDVDTASVSVVMGSSSCEAGLVDGLVLTADLDGSTVTGTVEGIAGAATAFSLPLAGTLAGDLVGGSFSGDVSVDAEIWTLFGVFTASR